jgi:hypothetical protein
MTSRNSNKNQNNNNNGNTNNANANVDETDNSFSDVQNLKNKMDQMQNFLARCYSNRPDNATLARETRCLPIDQNVIDLIAKNPLKSKNIFPERGLPIVVIKNQNNNVTVVETFAMPITTPEYFPAVDYDSYAIMEKILLAVPISITNALLTFCEEILNVDHCRLSVSALNLKVIMTGVPRVVCTRVTELQEMDVVRGNDTASWRIANPRIQVYLTNWEDMFRLILACIEKEKTLSTTFIAYANRLIKLKEMQTINLLMGHKQN